MESANRDDRPMSTQGKQFRWVYTFYWKFEIVLVTLMIISIISEIFCRSSLVASVFGQLPLPPNLKDAVEEVAKTVGFGSVLIAWIYAELDKTELGFKYRDLLLAMYPTYHRFVLVHLAAVFLSIFLAKVGAIEAACLALAILIWGCGIHWKALSNLVFNSKKRKQVAIDEWNRKIKACDVYKEETTKDLFIIIYSISDAITMQEAQHTQEMYLCFSKAVLKLSSCPYSLKRRLSDLANIWDHLLRNRPENERPTILSNVFNNIRSLSANQECEFLCPEGLGAVCTSYVLWLCKYHAEMSNTNNGGEEDALVGVANDVIFVTQQNWICENDDVNHYLDAAFAIQNWLHFLYGDIQLNSGHFSISPTAHKDGDNNLLREFASCIFTLPSFEENFQIAIRQIYANELEYQGGSSDGCTGCTS